MMLGFSKWSAIAVCSAMIAGAWAQSSEKLTIAGAQMGASADDLIPSFGGADTPIAGWSPGELRGDYWKFKDEKPLFTIDATNVDKYADKLSPGQLALFKQIKGYKMIVYPSHRNCAYPEWVQNNIKKNAAGAKLDADGNHLQSAVLPGLPFAGADTGQKVIWNYLTRYQGVGLEGSNIHTLVSPRPGSTDWIEVTSFGVSYFPWGKKGENPLTSKENLYSTYFQYVTPAAFAGQGTMANFHFADNEAEAYIYFPGQRRVRRMPSYDYDAPQIGFENQYTVDEPALFNGDIDRFDWKLIGKKELYVPYNDFGVYNFKRAVHDVFKQDSVDPSARRYELHRVYVVEATLKPNMRHSSQKKVMYFDEDTYLALVGDDYDAQGKLWKTKEGYPIPLWELGGTCDVQPFAQYNLTSGRYIVDSITVGAGKDIRFYEESSDPRFSSNYYSAETLRSISER
ncbi:DUF1329 domain-containing protein [Paraburkholderia megapolitana]|uniref:DUF1329 domain-containing protein n=1 Tax=Paraburkholderia megapolitana TaxID=420953 RepID=UPI0038BA1424